jgi:hypothetical protein
MLGTRRGEILSPARTAGTKFHLEALTEAIKAPGRNFLRCLLVGERHSPLRVPSGEKHAAANLEPHLQFLQNNLY